MSVPYQKIRLSKLLTFATAGLVGLLTSAVALIAYVQNTAAVDASTLVLRNQNNLMIIEEIREFLGHATRNNAYNSLLITDGSLDMHDLQAWIPRLVEENRIIAEVSNTAIANEFGDYVGVDERSDGSFYLQASRPAKGGMLRIHRMDSYGRFTEVLSEIPSYDPRRRPWYEAASAAGVSTWSSPYVHYAEPVLQVAASMPVIGKDGRKLGVLTSAVRLTVLSRFLESLPATEKGRVVLIDGEGLLLATSTQDVHVLVTDSSSKISRIRPEASADKLIALAGRWLSREVENQPAVKSVIQKTLSIDGSEYLLDIQPIGNGVNWLAVTIMPRSAFSGGADTTATTLLVSAFLATGLSLIGALLISRSVNHPLEQLRNAVRDFDGDGHFTIPESGILELSELSVAFEKMGHRVVQNGYQLKDSELAARLAAENARSALKQLALHKFALDQHAIVSATDAHGRITYVNGRFCTICGYSREELINQTHTILNSDVHPPVFYERIFEVISGGDVWHGELCCRAKDGHLYWLDSTVVPFIGESGKPEQYIAIRTDITQRKRAEQSLRDSEHMLSEAQRIGRIGSYVTDIKTGAWSSTTILDEIFGIDDSFVRTIESWGSLVAPEHRVMMLDYFHQVVAEHGVFEQKYKVIRGNDGQARWVAARGEFTFDSDGNPVTLRGIIQDVTEQKNIQDSLDESREKYRGLSEAAFEAVFISENGKCLEQNTRAEKMFGYTATEAVGRDGTNWVVPADRGRVRANMMSGYEQPYEVAGLRKDGSTFPAIIRANTMNYKGRVVRITSMQDITDLKQAEAALRESEEELRAIMDNAGNVIFVKDVVGRYLHVNRQYEKLFHVTDDAVIGKTDYDIFPADIANRFVENDQRVAQSGQITEIEEQVPHDDGLHTYISVKFPLRRSSGEIYAICGIATDITQRKANDLELESHRGHLEEMVQEKTVQLQETLDTLRISEEKYRVLLDDASDPIFTFSPDGEYRYVNHAFAATVGRTQEEVIGKKIWDIFPGDEGDERFASMAAVFASGETGTIEVCVSGAEGDRHLITTVKPVFGDQRQVISVICIAKDITERKRSEDAAHAANRAKSEFLANMSHELRTPMNGVVGMVDILQQSGLSGDQRRMVDTIHDSSLALLNILNDILDYSKIEAGKLVMEEIPTHLREVAEGVVQLMVTVANAKSVEISVFVSPELPCWIITDPTRLRQSLLNLLGNAVKFTGTRDDLPGRVILSVERRALTDGGSGLQLSVIDNGIGISQEVMSRLFQPFTQADESTSRKFGGTGLGLSITRRLVELMGGTLAVRSCLGEGSEFNIVLPLREAAPARPAAVVPSLVGVHLVAVHRDETTARIVRSYCAAAGADVTVVADLAAAREQLLASVRLTGSNGEVGAVSSAPTFRSGPTVVLLGVAVTTSTNELELPEDVGVVRLVRRGHTSSGNAIEVLARPLFYQDLIYGVAVASGRLSKAKSSDQTERRRPPPRTKALTVEQARLAGRLILLAEDNEINREVIQEQLRILGYASEVAADGAMALGMWRAGNYGLLLTDCHMPNMDGFDLTGAIRQAEPEGVHLPIIAVTANAMQGESERCIEHGMDDYLSKPLRLNELGPMLAKWLPAPAGPAVEATNAGGNKSGKEHGVAEPLVELAVWDAETLTRMVGNNPDMHHRLLASFLIVAKDDAAAIGDAIANEELGIAVTQAHRLKSSSRTVGALVLGEVCEKMESAGRSGDRIACRELAAQLGEAFAAASRAIEEHLNEPKA